MWVIYGARPGKVGSWKFRSKVSNGGRTKRSFFFLFYLSIFVKSISNPFTSPYDRIAQDDFLP